MSNFRVLRRLAQSELKVGFRSRNSLALKGLCSLLWLGFAAILALLLPGRAVAESVVLRGDFWMPVNGYPGDQKPGYAIELVREVFRRKGISLDYQITPWARSIRLARDGAIDGIVGASRGDAPDFVFPGERVGTTGYKFYVLPENPWAFQGIDSLSDKTLGVVSDYSYGATLDAYIQRWKDDPKRVQGVGGDSPLQQNIGKLQRGRVNVIVCNPETFRYELESIGIAAEKFREAGGVPETEDVHIAFSPAGEKGSRYAKILTDGIRELRGNGELAAIYQRYGMTPP